MWLEKQSTYCTSKLYHALYNYSIIVSEWPSLLLLLDIPNLSICLASLTYSSNLTQKKYALMPDISDVCSSKAVEMNTMLINHKFWGMSHLLWSQSVRCSKPFDFGQILTSKFLVLGHCLHLGFWGFVLTSVLAWDETGDSSSSGW